MSLSTVPAIHAAPLYCFPPIAPPYLLPLPFHPKRSNAGSIGFPYPSCFSDWPANSASENMQNERSLSQHPSSPPTIPPNPASLSPPPATQRPCHFYPQTVRENSSPLSGPLRGRDYELKREIKSWWPVQTQQTKANVKRKNRHVRKISKLCSAFRLAFLLFREYIYVLLLPATPT